MNGIRQASSTASIGVPFSTLGNSIRETVKETILDEVARTDSRLWRNAVNGAEDGNSPGQRRNTQLLHHHPSSTQGSGVNDPFSEFEDALDDLLIETSPRFWPKVPPHLQSSIHSSESDPFTLSKSELDRLSASIREDLIGTDHPVLNKAAAYFFEASADGGKKVRPMMVLLLSRALADTMRTTSLAATESTVGVDLASTSLHNGEANSMLLTDALPWQRPDLPQAQRRLAEISEMIHTASLFHDDVIDKADTRRGMPAVHTVFGNKMAILAGDYLLARASIGLARLRHVHVVETMSTIIEHLVRGEVMQLRGTSRQERSRERLDYYLRKNFFKTGSLMANSCKSTALLADCPPELVEASYRFGKHVGMAFQLMDDVLDFEGTLGQMGKPSLSDLQAGLATAPVLFAAEQFPSELEIMLDRKFGHEGDVERALDCVLRSTGMEQTKELARNHAEKAMEALVELDASLYRDALVQLACKVVARTK